ncbi:MAG: hypothetical protein Q4F11_07915 [Eubacteriales bacterium]|nr:hypothetical protein [Eubacteriales bacterium]
MRGSFNNVKKMSIMLLTVVSLTVMLTAGCRGKSPAKENLTTTDISVSEEKKQETETEHENGSSINQTQAITEALTEAPETEAPTEAQTEPSYAAPTEAPAEAPYVEPDTEVSYAEPAEVPKPAEPVEITPAEFNYKIGVPVAENASPDADVCPFELYTVTIRKVYDMEGNYAYIPGFYSKEPEFGTVRKYSLANFGKNANIIRVIGTYGDMGRVCYNFYFD